MPHLPCSTFVRTLALGVALLASGAIGTRQAAADATLIVEADTGKVLHAEHATYPWYPASTTKLLTAYLTLKAVKDKRLTLDTLLTVSPNAVAQAPSKMGFAAGTQVTIDNALKMLMVKSANDMAVVLAEGVSGSIEKFADDMNATSRRLGMTQSSWVNPNGLPADEQITSARDMALLARAILRDLPEYEMYWHIPAIKFGRRVMRNTNSLIGRYPEADGMKTGFICASGFNVVATATRGGRKLIVVVFGAHSGATRSEKAAQLFEKGFNSGGLSWLMPSLGTVDSLQPIAAAPPNLRDEMCGKNRKRPAAESDDDEVAATPNDADPSSAYAVAANNLSKATKHIPLLGPPVAVTPVVVFVGAGKKQQDAGPQLASAPADKPAKTKTAAPKLTPDQLKGKTVNASVLPGAKPAAAKPAAPKPKPAAGATTAAAPAAGAHPKPAAKPAAPKPAAASTGAKQSAVKPAAAQTAAKPAEKPAKQQ